jgi:hypothetical protein
MIGVRPGPLILLFTMASTIGAVNAVVGGVGATLLIVAIGGGDTVPAAIAIGVAVAGGRVWLTIAYQRRRYRLMYAADEARLGAASAEG